MSCIERDNSCWREMIANLGEKLARGELERDVRLLEGIDNDKIVFLMCGCRKDATILLVDVQIGFIHVKIFTPDINNCWIDLDPINRHGTINLSELMRNGAPCQADNSDAV